MNEPVYRGMTLERHSTLAEQISGPRHVYLLVGGEPIRHQTAPLPPLEPEGAWQVGDPIRFTAAAAKDYGQALENHYGVRVSFLPVTYE